MSDNVSLYTQVSVVVALAGALLSTAIYVFSVSMPLINGRINHFATAMESFPEYRISTAQEASVNRTNCGIPRAEAARILIENRDEIFSICYAWEVYITEKKSDVPYDFTKGDSYLRKVYGKKSCWNTCRYTSKNSIYFYHSKYFGASIDEVIDKIAKGEDICDKVVIRYTKDYLNRIHVIVYPYQWTGYAEVFGTYESYKLPCVYPVPIEGNSMFRDEYIDIQKNGIIDLITGKNCNI